MLKIKKIGAALLSIIMSIHIVPASLLASMQIYAEDNNETTKYVLPIQKNGIETLEIEVYEQNGKYYTIPQNIADLTRTEYIETEPCPVYGGESFVFQQGIFEVSVDVENQKMYSYLTEYEYSIRDVLESKINLVNNYLNLDDPIKNYTEFDKKVTADMIEQVNLPDEVKEIFISEPEFSMKTYALDNTDVSIVNIESQYMIELIPWLKYMGAECSVSDNGLNVNMPHRTLWESIMPDLHGNTHNKVQAEKSTAHNVWDVSCSVFVDVISDIPGFIKNTAIDVYKDVTGQQSDDKYTEEAIYDILKVDYSKSQQINDKVEAINEFVGLANSDVINASASIYEFAYDEYDSYLPYLTNYIPNDKYEELCDRAIKMENLKNNTEALKFVLGCVVTINEKLNYSDDTKQSLNNILGQSIDSYVRDDFDGKWTDTARRIMKDIDSTENIVTGAILKEGIDFLFDKGKDEGLALFGKQNYATLSLDLAKSLLINAPMFRPVWEGYDAQLYMIKQNEIQVDMLELIDSIVKKSINAEKCSNAASLTELADALKFYYRAVIAHANNSVQYLEEIDMFNKNGDALIKEYKALSEKATEYLYNISNCTVTSFKKYDTLKNDVINEEWLNIITQNIFEAIPSKFVFSSGVGAWGTTIEINKDGSFAGNYHDSEMSVSDTQYPNGTVYSCSFKGKFSKPRRINEYTYSLKTIYFEVEGVVGSEHIEDGIRYVNCEPHGFKDTNEFILYLPGNKLKDMPQENISYISNMLNSGRETLPEGMYALYNKTYKSDFWGIKENSIWNSSYVHYFNGYKVQINPGYINSRVSFYDDKNKYEHGFTFNWVRDNQTEFEAQDTKLNKNYAISLGVSDDKKTITVKIECDDVIDLTKWGGTSYGTLTADYHLLTNYNEEELKKLHVTANENDLSETDKLIYSAMNIISTYPGVQNIAFQDFNFDGNCELIIGDISDNGTKYIAYTFIYEYDGNEFVNSNIIDEGVATAELHLYNKADEEYVYLINTTGQTFGCRTTYYFDGNTKRIIFKEDVDFDENYNEIYTMHDENGDVITEEQYGKLYSEFINDMNVCNYGVDIINISEYKNMSKQEKYNRLKKSYESFIINN